MKLIFRLLTILTFYFASSGAWASGCSISPAHFVIDIPSIQVQPDAPVGSIIYSKTQSFPSAYYTCPGNVTEVGINDVGVDTGISYYKCRVYSTNIPGIGYTSIHGQISDCPSGGTGSTGNSYLTPPFNFSPQAGGSGFGPTFSFALVKTGVIESGTLIPGLYTHSDYDGQRYSDITLGSATPITGLSCTLNDTNIQVPLNDVPADKFSGIGSTPKSQDFTVGLQCNSQANISASLNGEQSADTSDDSVMALTNAGSANVATGVGVQILYNGTPLKIGSAVSFGTAEANVQKLYPFTARYYQTKETVSAGEANTTATLNITYQ